MSIRADRLQAFGLPDCDAFEIEPRRYPTGLWGVAIACSGDPETIFTIGSATKLADAVREIDPGLAQQIDENVEKARRSS